MMGFIRFHPLLLLVFAFALMLGAPRLHGIVTASG